jgi:hypothetical protein
LPGQSSTSLALKDVRRYGIAGLTIHLAGFALGTLSISLVLSGIIGFESGLAMLTPFADALYGLGLVIAVAMASKADVPMKSLLVAGIAIGVGLFFKSAPHEFHIASGLGFGLPHNGHVVLGTIMITISVVSIVIMTLIYNKFNQKRNTVE